MDLLTNTREDLVLTVILKTMYIVNRLKKYEKDETVKALLLNIMEKTHNEDTKTGARKLVDDF